MFRKLSIIVSLLALSTAVMSVSADASTDGCYVNKTVTAVNEGMPINVSIECANIPASNNVFGFQFGATVVADGIVGSVPSTYAPGTFSTSAVGGVAGTFIGGNALALYGVSRQNNDVVTQTSFSLGTLALTADTNRGTGSGLTDGDGSVAVTFDTGVFKLSNNLGVSLPGWVRTLHDATIDVTDIDLAWLSGSATVQSDSPAMTNLKTVVLNLGAKQYTATTMAAGYQSSLTMDATKLYVEDASGVVGGSLATANASDNELDIAVTADMFGHLACSTTAVNLGDVGAAEDVTTVAVGTSGIVTLKAGDANNDGFISNSDATVIGLDFGDTGGLINASTEDDINLDGTVNILDLVHVGRNFSAGAGTAVTTCS